MRFRELVSTVSSTWYVAVCATDTSETGAISRLFDRAKAALECNVCKVRIRDGISIHLNDTSSLAGFELSLHLFMSTFESHGR